MAKKPSKKAAKKTTAKQVAKNTKATAKKQKPKQLVKPVKKAAKKVVKKVTKKVQAKKILAKKKVTKKSAKVGAGALKVTKKGVLKGLPAPKATIKPVVKGRIPEKLTKISVPASVKSMKFDEASWDKMSKSQKRVFIVTNCVKFMEHGLKVAKGDYIKSPSLEKSISRLGQRTDFKNMLENASDVTCCGAGILLYADILLRGNYDIYSSNKMNEIGLSDIAKRLDYFDVEQLKQIESAFETKWAFSSDDKSHMPAIQFGMKILDDKRRMAAILQNIIRYDGSFQP
jgi:hypothetical protein